MIVHIKGGYKKGNMEALGSIKKNVMNYLKSKQEHLLHNEYIIDREPKLCAKEMLSDRIHALNLEFYMSCMNAIYLI